MNNAVAQSNTPEQPSAPKQPARALRPEDLDGTELVAACSAGAVPECWNEFVRRYGNLLQMAVRSAVYRWGHGQDRELVEDLVQEVYCRLLDHGARRLSRCRGGDDRAVRVYLHRTAERVVVDHLRVAGAAKRGRDVLVAEREEGPTWVEWAVDPLASTERRTLVREGMNAFRDRAAVALAGPNRDRDLRVLCLALFGGWTSREIASEVPETSANGIDSMIHRAKARLAAQGVSMFKRKRLSA